MKTAIYKSLALSVLFTFLAGVAYSQKYISTPKCIVIEDAQGNKMCKHLPEIKQYVLAKKVHKVPNHRKLEKRDYTISPARKEK